MYSADYVKELEANHHKLVAAHHRLWRVHCDVKAENDLCKAALKELYETTAPLDDDVYETYEDLVLRARARAVAGQILRAAAVVALGRDGTDGD